MFQVLSFNRLFSKQHLCHDVRYRPWNNFIYWKFEILQKKLRRMLVHSEMEYENLNMFTNMRLNFVSTNYTLVPFEARRDVSDLIWYAHNLCGFASVEAPVAQIFLGPVTSFSSDTIPTFLHLIFCISRVYIRTCPKDWYEWRVSRVRYFIGSNFVWTQINPKNILNFNELKI